MAVHDLRERTFDLSRRIGALCLELLTTNFNKSNVPEIAKLGLGDNIEKGYFIGIHSHRNIN